MADTNASVNSATMSPSTARGSLYNTLTLPPEVSTVTKTIEDIKVKMGSMGVSQCLSIRLRYYVLSMLECNAILILGSPRRRGQEHHQHGPKWYRKTDRATPKKVRYTQTKQIFKSSSQFYFCRIRKELDDQQKKQEDQIQEIQGTPHFVCERDPLTLFDSAASKGLGTRCN